MYEKLISLVDSVSGKMRNSTKKLLNENGDIRKKTKVSFI
jgi:hypothetical protein